MSEGNKKTFGAPSGAKTFGNMTGESKVEPRGILSDHATKSKKKPKAKKPEKEKYDQKFSMYFTVKQREILARKSGLASDATYLRHHLEQSGFFDE